MSTPIDLATLQLDLPLPGAGQTFLRWHQLARWAAQDLAQAKLLEAHYDALAILHDLQCASLPFKATMWAVWAAESTKHTLRLIPQGQGYVLEGEKPWCTGWGLASHALVTAQADTGPVLAAVALAQPSIRFDAAQWQALGMQGAPTAIGQFHGAAAERVATAEAYLQRPGFWHGGAGIAACWWGGAAAVAQKLSQNLRPSRPHAAAQLGQVYALLQGARHSLAALAQQIDNDPQNAHWLAVQASRLLTKRVALETVERVNDALGPGPLCQDRQHAQRCADLQVWVRQYHAGSDEEALGQELHERGVSWN